MPLSCSRGILTSGLRLDPYRIEVEGLLYNFWLPVVSHINLNILEN